MCSLTEAMNAPAPENVAPSTDAAAEIPDSGSEEADLENPNGEE